MPEPKPQTDADRSLMRDIATRGWHIVTVEERNDRPGWAFTIGLQSSFEHPEVIVFGLPTQANRKIIERIARDIAAGSAHPAGSTCDTILQGLPCEFRAVARSWHETFLENREASESDLELQRRLNACVEASLEPVTPVTRKGLEAVNPVWLNIAGMAAEAERDERGSGRPTG